MHDAIKALIDAEVAADKEWNGPDWWQLTDAEAEVFHIRRKRWRAIMSKNFVLTALLDYTYPELPIPEENLEYPITLKTLKAIDALRKEHPELIAEMQARKYEDLANEFGEVAKRELRRIDLKYRAWCERPREPLD